MRPRQTWIILKPCSHRVCLSMIEPHSPQIFFPVLPAAALNYIYHRLREGVQAATEAAPFVQVTLISCHFGACLKLWEGDTKYQPPTVPHGLPHSQTTDLHFQFFKLHSQSWCQLLIRYLKILCFPVCSTQGLQKNEAFPNLIGFSLLPCLLESLSRLKSLKKT